MRRRVCPRCLEPLIAPVWRDATGAPTRPPVERRPRWQRLLDPLRTDPLPVPTARDAAGAAAASVVPVSYTHLTLPTKRIV